MTDSHANSAIRQSATIIACWSASRARGRRRSTAWSAPSRVAGVAPAAVVIYAEPIDAAGAAGAAPVALSQKNKTFQPRLLAVPVGIDGRLPEQRRHLPQRVLAVGPAAVRPRSVPRRRDASRTFTLAGHLPRLLQHPPADDGDDRRRAERFTTLAGADGRFTLDLPPGRYRMTALSERAAAGLGRRDEHRGRLDRAGSDARRDRVDVRAAQEQVRVRTIRPPHTRSRAAL